MEKNKQTKKNYSRDLFKILTLGIPLRTPAKATVKELYKRNKQLAANALLSSPSLHHSAMSELINKACLYFKETENPCKQNFFRKAFQNFAIHGLFFFFNSLQGLIPYHSREFKIFPFSSTQTKALLVQTDFYLIQLQKEHFLKFINI